MLRTGARSWWTGLVLMAGVGGMLGGTARCSADDDREPPIGGDGETTAGETTGDEGVGPGLPEGESCVSNGEPACAAGLQCVQESPPYCSGDYLGRCERVPADCAGEPTAETCACDGAAFRNACEARRAGQAGLLDPC